jgi:hypothetical protein
MVTAGGGFIPMVVMKMFKFKHQIAIGWRWVGERSAMTM